MAANNTLTDRLQDELLEDSEHDELEPSPTDDDEPEPSPTDDDELEPSPTDDDDDDDDHWRDSDGSFVFGLLSGALGGLILAAFVLKGAKPDTRRGVNWGLLLHIPLIFLVFVTQTTGGGE